MQVLWRGVSASSLERLTRDVHPDRITVSSIVSAPPDQFAHHLVLDGAWEFRHAVVQDGNGRTLRVEQPTAGQWLIDGVTVDAHDLVLDYPGLFLRDEP